MKKTKIIIIACLLLAFTFAFTACSRGASAYEIAVRQGFSGTEEEWIQSLKGERGQAGTDGVNFNVGYTAYDLYNECVQNGTFTGTFSDFIKEYFAASDNNDAKSAVNTAVFSVCSVYCSFTLTSMGRKTTGTSAGSGVIYSVDKSTGDALIVTNYHVVYNSSATTSDKVSDDIEIYLYGNESKSGAIACEYVGGTAKYDLAVLKVSASDIIKGSNAKAVVFADSDEIALGQSVIAIGNPEAQGISVTKGILSVESEEIALNDITGDTNNIRVLRYDASVNPGNSGGGLFNSQGQLVGIVNAKTVDEEVDNMNYAIPSNTVAGVVKGIIEWCLDKTNKNYYRAYFGISISSKDSYAYYDQDTDRVVTEETTFVSKVYDNTLAKDKIIEGDVFVKVSINGKEKQLKRNYQLIDVALSLSVGDQVVFTVIRNGETVEVPITVTQGCFEKID